MRPAKSSRTGLAGTLHTAVLVSLAVLTVHATAGTDIYRCTTPSGAIEFRQQACSAGTEEEEITIEDQKTGWKPGETKIEKSKASSSKKSSASKRKEADKKKREAAKQADKCWDKRQKLDEVNWKLRRGYSASQGVKLRRKRQTYEEYIRRYCK